MSFGAQTSKFRGLATFLGFNSIVHFLLLAQKKRHHEQSSFSAQNAISGTLGCLPFSPQISRTVRG